MNPTNPQQDPSFRHFGRYLILGELGRGGMATVYRARDPRFGREVAIKVLPHELLHDNTFRERFDREARTIATLEHSAIVPVYDYGKEDGQPFLVMRFMSGGSLEDKIRKGRLDLDEVSRIFTHLAPALDRAHRRGIVHRDLKPGNILFDEAGEAYISDFGIVKLAEATHTLTAGGIVGTPAYMSPEQGKGKKDIDGRSDVYALGCILYHALTSRLPYTADTPTDMIMCQLTKPAPNLLAARPDLPRNIQQVLERAMAKDREQRFATAGELAAALAGLASGKGEPAPAAQAGDLAAPLHPSAPEERVLPQPDIQRVQAPGTADKAIQREGPPATLGLPEEGAAQLSQPALGEAQTLAVSRLADEAQSMSPAAKSNLRRLALYGLMTCAVVLVLLLFGGLTALGWYAYTSLAHSRPTPTLSLPVFEPLVTLTNSSTPDPTPSLTARPTKTPTPTASSTIVPKGKPKKKK